MYLKSITLQNFRQFEKAQFELHPRLTLIQGNNTKGKSSILEAIFYTANCYSPFSSKDTDLMNYNIDANFFRLSAKFENEYEEEIDLALFSDGLSKQFTSDNHKTTRSKYLENLSATIFSPEQIEYLMLSPEKRRKYLDFITSKLSKSYNRELAQYKRVITQRNAHLKKLAKAFYSSGHMETDDQQLDFWDHKLAEHGEFIYRERFATIKQMHNEHFEIKYVSTVEELSFQEGSDDKSAFILQLKDNRRKDIATKQTTIGPHRDDWKIITNKNIHIHGSRGEKRMAIGRMILQSQELINEKTSKYPLLLLDDISSELDPINSEKIIKESLDKGYQVVISAIHDDEFKFDIGEHKVIKL